MEMFQIFAITMLPTLVISVMLWVEVNIMKMTGSDIKSQFEQLLAFVKGL